jgi:type I restriction enzyme S subunit
MAMKKYDEYKDIGVDWIGEIPSEWNAKKLKFLLPSRMDKRVAKDSQLPYIGMENIESFTGKFIEGGEDAEGLANYFFEGDVLFGKLRPYLCKVYRAEFTGLCSTEFIVFESSNDYFQKLLSSPSFINLVQSSTYGSKMPRANPEWISNQYLPVPSGEEQTAIATFLDQKTTQIDAAIAQKEQLIELLKERKQIIIQRAVTRGLDETVEMKDSGVEWIGEVPEHWEVTRFKNLYTQSRLPVRKKDGTVTSYRDGEVTLRSNRRLTGYTEAILEHGFQGIRKGHLVLNSMDAFEGAIGVSDSDGKCTPEYLVCDKRSADTSNYYFAYLLREMALAKYIQVICNAVRQRAVRIRFNNLATRFVVVPPPKEQKIIVDFIKSSSTKIDLAIQHQTQQIAKLREYRTVLIDAAVTGKIKVPKTNRS